jgi:NAD(P)-dependent dehydrogenase (short-subunit alcohol dehydrogenase family)
MDRVKNKVAIVTGGAVGLGRAQAQLLAKEGASVIVTDIKEAEGQECVKEIEAAGGIATFLQHDVTDEERWQFVVDEALQEFGHLDVLVNNAGVLLSEPLVSTSLESWKNLMAINLDGVFLGMKTAIPAMLDAEQGGSIINISSIAGIVGIPNLAAYNSSKGGVRLMTKVAAMEHALDRIRVNSVHPGYIWTDMVEDLLSKGGGDLEQAKEALGASIPMGRVGQPDEIAYGVLYLASDESMFMTGSELVIDGGSTAQ